MTVFAALALFAVAVAALMIALDTLRAREQRDLDERIDRMYGAIAQHLTAEGMDLLAKERAGMLTGHEWGH